MVDRTRHTAFISVGSNLGDKAANCRRGLDRLVAESGSRITGRSNFYRTAPTDFKDQGWFVNGALRISTPFDPEALLAAAKSVEKAAGRPAEGVRFGPRVLDLDIIFFDDGILDLPGLRIPHPRMHLRRFVLAPICDIDPTFVHPVLRKTVRDLLDAIDDAQQTVVPVET